MAKKYQSISDVINYDSPEGSNSFTVPFKDLTRYFGRDYIQFCADAWAANDGCLTEAEFVVVNGNMPRKFFERTIKRAAQKVLLG